MPSVKSHRPHAVVTLLGVPNAGKSTLFNRLLGERRALVTDMPGTTRDRIYARWRAGDKPCVLCDTGGVTGPRPGNLQDEIRRQTLIAVEEASVIVLVLDGRARLTAGDRDLAAMLRPIADRVLVAWNKADTPEAALGATEGFELGLGEPVAVSAEHGLGIADLVEAIADRLPAAAVETSAAPAVEVRVAIVGRPNVGKSSLLNRLCGEVRAAVAPLPGTTRDAVDVEIVRGARLYRFVDTAGIRRPARASGKAEWLGVLTAKRAIERCDVALVLFDAEAGLVSQDLAIAGLVEQSGRGAVLVANKWDLVAHKEERVKSLQRELESRLRFARFSPLVTVSALEGQRAEALYKYIDQVDEAASVMIPTPKLNRFLGTFRGASENGGRMRYMTQVGTRPPSFLVFASGAPSQGAPHISVVRGLENRLREEFGIGPTPVRIRFRRGSSRAPRPRPSARPAKAR